jgi:hypothetical protein
VDVVVDEGITVAVEDLCVSLDAVINGEAPINLEGAPAEARLEVVARGCPACVFLLSTRGCPRPDVPSLINVQRRRAIGFGGTPRRSLSGGALPGNRDERTTSGPS